MADILIKNMELPCTITIYPNGDIDELIDGKYVTIGKAVELPPHGRLIDADKLIAGFRKWSNAPIKRTNNEIAYFLEGYAKYSTVLEAST